MRPASVRELLLGQLDALASTTDLSFRFLYANNIVRAVLQHAALATLEYCARSATEAEPYDPVVLPTPWNFNARSTPDRLACLAYYVWQGNDGDLRHSLDHLVVMAREMEWTDVGQVWDWWDPAAPATADARLSSRVEKWVWLRNGRFAHGVVSRDLLRDELPEVEELARDLLDGLGPLVDLRPDEDDEVLLLDAPAGPIRVPCLRLVAGNPIHLQLRKCRPTMRGGWCLRYQTLDPDSSEEDEFFVGQDASPSFALVEAGRTNKPRPPRNP